MKIKQQFAAVTMVVGLIMAITCGVGYYMAQSMLSHSCLLYTSPSPRD